MLCAGKVYSHLIQCKWRGGMVSLAIAAQLLTEWQPWIYVLVSTALTHTASCVLVCLPGLAGASAQWFLPASSGCTQQFPQDLHDNIFSGLPKTGWEDKLLNEKLYCAATLDICQMAERWIKVCPGKSVGLSLGISFDLYLRGVPSPFAFSIKAEPDDEYARDNFTQRSHSCFKGSQSEDSSWVWCFAPHLTLTKTIM